jgi:hypothetical protein
MTNIGVPANPTLLALGRLIDTAQRWIDHAESENDQVEIELILDSLSQKHAQLASHVRLLETCFNNPSAY